MRAGAVVDVESSACINHWHKSCTTSEILSNLLLLIYAISISINLPIEFCKNQIPEF